jgi:hypothetical protein
MAGHRHSGNTARMAEVLETADGRVSLAAHNRGLFSGAETWESLVMRAWIYERVATLLGEATSDGGTQEAAASALARAANLIDGVPDDEDNVPLWRNAPANLDWCDWQTVAKTVAASWSDHAHKMLGTAEGVRSNQNARSTPAVPKVRDFTGKVRKCVACGAKIPDGDLECAACGSSRFIWEDV